MSSRECAIHSHIFDVSDDLGCPVCFGISIENARLVASFRLWGYTHLNLEESPRVVSTLDSFNLYLSSLETKSESADNE